MVEALHRATGSALSFTDIDINWGDLHLSHPGGVPHVADANGIIELSCSVAQLLRANGRGVGTFYTSFGAVHQLTKSR